MWIPSIKCNIFESLRKKGSRAGAVYLHKVFVLENPSDPDFISAGDTTFLQELIKDTKIHLTPLALMTFPPNQIFVFHLWQICSWSRLTVYLKLGISSCIRLADWDKSIHWNRNPCVHVTCICKVNYYFLCCFAVLCVWVCVCVGFAFNLTKLPGNSSCVDHLREGVRMGAG